jgi:hypothetical protein
VGDAKWRLVGVASWRGALGRRPRRRRSAFVHCTGGRAASVGRGVVAPSGNRRRAGPLRASGEVSVGDGSATAVKGTEAKVASANITEVNFIFHKSRDAQRCVGEMGEEEMVEDVWGVAVDGDRGKDGD